ncbi:hypothetical protein KAJ27_15420, partial [bacterium]|nr:hypothetical protein [bacterium]
MNNTADESMNEKSYKTRAMKSVSCDKCKAEISLPGGTTINTCPFCGSVIKTQAIEAEIHISEHILPFTVVKSEAESSYKYWLQSRVFLPDKVKRLAKDTSDMTQVFIPAWIFDYKAHVSWINTYQKKMSTEELNNVRKNQKITSSCNSIIMYGGKCLPIAEFYTLDPWDLQAKEVFESQHFEGITLENHNPNMDAAFEAGKGGMEKELRIAVADTGSKPHPKDVQYSYSDIQAKYIYLPVWIKSYIYKDNFYHIMMNGRTGEINGNRPKSGLKKLRAFLTAIAIPIIFAYLANHP